VNPYSVLLDGNEGQTFYTFVTAPDPIAAVIAAHDELHLARYGTPRPKTEDDVNLDALLVIAGHHQDLIH
jgi:hypothetical protein